MRNENRIARQEPHNGLLARSVARLYSDTLLGLLAKAND